MMTSKTQTALTLFQLPVAVVAASRRPVGIDLEHQILSSQIFAAAERTVDYSFARASCLCCKQGVGPAAARMPGEVVMSFARAWHRRLATQCFLFQEMGFLGQTASVGFLRDVQSVGKAWPEAATLVEEQTAAFGE